MTACKHDPLRCADIACRSSERCMYDDSPPWSPAMTEITPARMRELADRADSEADGCINGNIDIGPSLVIRLAAALRAAAEQVEERNAAIAQQAIKLAARDALLKRAGEVAERNRRLHDEALPKFNWGASALDANAIGLLNEVPNENRALAAEIAAALGDKTDV